MLCGYCQHELTPSTDNYPSPLFVCMNSECPGQRIHSECGWPVDRHTRLFAFCPEREEFENTITREENSHLLDLSLRLSRFEDIEDPTEPHLAIAWRYIRRAAGDLSA